MASSLERAFRENRWTGIGAVAVIVGVVFAYASLRRGAAPVVISAPTGSGTSDLSAFTAGASAAGSGFDTGAALGQGALGLAGSVVASQSGVASTLAASQAQVASGATSDLAAALAAAMGAQSNPAAPAPIYITLGGGLAPDPGNPPPGATLTPTPTICATLTSQIAAASLAVATMQGYVNTYLAIPLSQRTDRQKTALATDQATLLIDQQKLAALRAQAAAAGC